MSKDKKITFNSFELLMITVFGLISILVLFYCNAYLNFSDDWITFSLYGCVYFFLGLLVWLDGSRDEKEGIVFWQTFMLIFFQTVVLLIFIYLFKSNILPMPQGIHRHGVQFLFVVVMSIATVVGCQKIVDLFKNK